MNNRVQTILGGIIILLLILIWQHQNPGQVRWEYKIFKWDSDVTVGSYSDKRVTYHEYVAFKDSAPRAATNIGIDLAETDSRMVYAVVNVLDYIGADGWEFCWTDGTNYTMKRPLGTWTHSTFDLGYRAETNQ